MIFKIDPYKPGSKGAKALSQALGCQRLKKNNSRFVQKARHSVINWGNSVHHQRVTGGYDYNLPDAVKLASCKLRTFNVLEIYNVPTPEWTTSHAEASEWLREGEKVYCRHTTRGKGGQGITIIEAESVNEDTTCYPELPSVPLYTKGLDSWDECRIHIDKNGTIIDWQRKLRRNGAESPNTIRNHENEYVFCRNVEPPPEVAFEVARDAVKALGLDFGAVDVAFFLTGGAKVFEVNSAPGLEGTTLDNYVSYFRNGEDHVRC